MHMTPSESSRDIVSYIHTYGVCTCTYLSFTYSVPSFNTSRILVQATWGKVNTYLVESTRAGRYFKNLGQWRERKWSERVDTRT